MSTSRVLALLLAIIGLAGCTKTVQHRVADFFPGAAPTTQPVPKTAVYSIRFLDEKGKKTGGVPNSHRLMQAGDHVGFDVDESAGLVAIAASDRFPIEIPAGHGAVWSATYHKPTQFSKEVAKATTTTAQAAGFFAVEFVKAILRAEDDDDCDDYLDNQNLRMSRHLQDQRRSRDRR